MKLTTEIPLQLSSSPLDYESKLLSLGSCFAEHIGDKLTYYKFRTTQNPFGILFHPQALLNVLEKALSNEFFSVEDVFQQDQKWHSFYAHSRLSRESSAEIIAELNSAGKELKSACVESSHILITLGTAFIYKHKASGLPVANCHKVPQTEFEKQLTSVVELHQILSKLITCIREINPKVNIIFTVSPVRHIKDGMLENSRSKSHLIAALHSVIEEMVSSKVQYFPSYELMMDEFRDYRFYKRDLIHPSELAIDMIWEKFKHSFISEGIYEDMAKVEKLQKSLAHRPMDSSGKTDSKLRAYQYKFKEELIKKYSFMRF
jgi:hypothetical protein